MIKGLAITPPVIGRIAIGHVVERNGKRLPEKDDHFTITTQVQNREGWMLHPLHGQLADAAGGKLRAIPVKMLFNTPDLNLRTAYCMFDRSNGRLACTGDGEHARRQSDDGVIDQACPTPELCTWGQTGNCKLYGRLNVQIDGQADELGTFIFRTTGYNSIRTLTARLHYFAAVSAGRLRHLPLLLRLRARSTTQSRGTPIYYADLTLREGACLEEVVRMAAEEATRQQQAGIDATRWEACAQQLMANGRSEEAEEEVSAVIEEFYPESGEHADGIDAAPSSATSHAAKTPTIRNTSARRAPLMARLGSSAGGEQTPTSAS